MRTQKKKNKLSIDWAGTKKIRTGMAKRNLLVGRGNLYTRSPLISSTLAVPVVPSL